MRKQQLIILNEMETRRKARYNIARPLRVRTPDDDKGDDESGQEQQETHDRGEPTTINPDFCAVRLRQRDHLLAMRRRP